MQSLTAEPASTVHPVLSVVARISDALASVAAVNPSFMRTPEKAAALAELTRVESQAAELRLRILAGADDVAAEHAGRDVAAWLQWATRCRGEDARADLRLALALDRRYPTLGSALREGSANLAQARVIAKMLDELPGEIPAEVLARAEEALVGHCAEFGPRQLAQIGRRIVDVVAPEIADAHEARALARLEEKAHRATRLAFHRVGDGTTRITGLLPDLAAHRLVTYLEAFTNPRKTITPDRRPYPRRLGKGVREVPRSRRPPTSPDPRRRRHHGRHHHGSPRSHRRARHRRRPRRWREDHRRPGRRLACNAHLIPAVLGPERSGSQVLDLGRSTRLFNAAQRKALLIRDRECRAEGCDIPGTWTEAHHWIPWSKHGTSDLSNAVLLCSRHHHRAHDPAYEADRLPNGDVRFSRRT